MRDLRYGDDSGVPGMEEGEVIFQPNKRTFLLEFPDPTSLKIIDEACSS